MREGKLHSQDAFSDFSVHGPIHQETRQLFRSGTAQPDGTDAFVSGMAIAAGVLGNLEASVAVFLDVAHELLAADKGQLRWLESLHGDVVRPSGEERV